MNSSLIGKIDKAKRYAQEKERVSIGEISATFRGENDEHTVMLRNSKWHCTCLFFEGWNICSHTMAFEKIFTDAGLNVPLQQQVHDESMSSV